MVSRRIQANRIMPFATIFALILATDNVIRIAHSSSKLKIVLFIAPKENFSAVPENLMLWRQALVEAGGNVVLLLNRISDIRLAIAAGFLTEPVLLSRRGLPLLSSILQTTTRYKTSIVGLCNSDLSPNGAKTSAFLRYLAAEHVALLSHIDVLNVFHDELRGKWLIAANRFDFNEDVARREPHMSGGVDFWLWNHASSGFMGFKAQIPTFRLGRPLFDNWLTATVMQLGQRRTIDATFVLDVLHKNHKRLGHLSDWRNTTLLMYDEDWLENKRLSKVRICISNICSRYRGGFGTACEAPYYFKSDDDFDNGPKYAVQKRSLTKPCRPSHRITSALLIPKTQAVVA